MADQPANEAPATDVRQRHPLARGMELLTYMVESPRDSHGVRELAAVLEVSPSTVHRLVTDLDRLGLVRRAENGSYRIGLEFLRLSWLTTTRYPAQELSFDPLTRLMNDSGESAFFALYDEQRLSMLFSVAIESPHPLRYSLPLQQWLPLHAGASGLAILASTPTEVQERVVQGHLSELTMHTITNPDALRERLEEVRTQGYALSEGERIVGTVAIAAPVFGPTGTIAGAAGLSIPEVRFDRSKAERLIALVQGTAAQITTNLSGRGSGAKHRM